MSAAPLIAKAFFVGRSSELLICWSPQPFEHGELPRISHRIATPAEARAPSLRRWMASWPSQITDRGEERVMVRRNRSISCRIRAGALPDRKASGRLSVLSGSRRLRTGRCCAVGPLRHELAALDEKLRARIGGTHLARNRVRQCRLRHLVGHLRNPGTPLLEARAEACAVALPAKPAPRRIVYVQHRMLADGER